METRMVPAGTVVPDRGRRRELVANDIEDGYVSPQMAATRYGLSRMGRIERTDTISARDESPLLGPIDRSKLA